MVTPMLEEIIETLPEGEETTTTEPVGTTTPVIESPAVDWTNAEQQTRAAEALERLAKWGDPTGVDQALAIQHALTTEEGITALFEKAGAALGVSADKLAALFGVEEVEPEDEDRPLTVREMKELMAKEVTGPAAQREQAARDATASATVQSVLGELKVTDDAEVRAVLAAGQRYLEDGDFDPDHIKAAVRKGYADYERAAKARFVAYVGKKVQDAKDLPGSIGGNSPGGETLPEPKNVDEAMARARARLLG